MADTQLLKLLRDAGDDAQIPLELWRVSHDDENPDLSGVDISGLVFRRASTAGSLSRVNLTGATYRNGSWVVIAGSNCEGADLSGTPLSYLDWANLKGTKLDGCTIQETTARGAQFDDKTSFVGTKVDRLDLTGATGLDLERFKQEVAYPASVVLPDGTTWQKPPPT